MTTTKTAPIFVILLIVGVVAFAAASGFTFAPQGDSEGSRLLVMRTAPKNGNGDGGGPIHHNNSYDGQTTTMAMTMPIATAQNVAAEMAKATTEEQHQGEYRTTKATLL